MRSRPLLLAVVLALAWPAVARAGGPPPAVASFEELLARLGEPADPQVVRALLAREATQGADGALRVVDALWAAGGHAAAEGFRQLADHADARVRERALRALALLGLRGHDHMDRVRHAVQDDVEAVRLAAHEALARVGDAEDVPALLASAASPDPRLRQIALRGLRTLTGEGMGYVANRWVSWWPVAQPEIAQSVQEALATVENGGTEAEVSCARSVLGKRGWAALPEVEAAVSAWLLSQDARLRAEAFRTAAALRLGDLAEDVGAASRYESDPAVLALAADAAKVLGASIPKGSKTSPGGVASRPPAPAAPPPIAPPPAASAPEAPSTPSALPARTPPPSSPPPERRTGPTGSPTPIQGDAATAPPLPPR